MKTFIKNLSKVLSRENENMRERMLCIINLVSLALAVIGLIETIPLADATKFAILLFVFLITILISTFILLKAKNLKIASAIDQLALSLLLCPGVFFLSGGIAGGASVYLSLTIIYTCIMFEGRELFIFGAIAVLADIFTYALAYQYPDAIQQLASKEAIFTDSLYSVIAVGIAVGIMIKIHIHAYERKRLLAEKQNVELEKNSESKSHFFASMSHEIRTPINTVIGLNEMILREADNADIIEYSENIENASKMLLSLVNDILDLSQMEMGRMEILPIEYSTKELVRELVQMNQVQMKEKDLKFLVEVDPDLPCVLKGDRKRIEQVMINLLTNAAKYTKEGSVTLSVKVESRDNQQVKIRLSVQDTGVGIRKEDIATLYELFKRVDVKTNQKVEGSGLGLAITKQLVDLMGGELIVDSIYTKGSIFTVLLTQEIIDGTAIENFEQQERMAINLVKREPYKKLFEAPEARILIVDDNNMNLMVAKKLLSATKVQIETATSGMECLEKTKNRYYHVILLDHMMAGMDGVETIKAVRSQDNGLCRDSAIIAMTGNAFPNADNFYRDLSFDAYIEKPINGNLLERKILFSIPPEIVEYQRESNSEYEAHLYQKVQSKRRKRIMITTDCVADLPNGFATQHDIGVMYLYIRTDKGRFADTIEIDSDNLAQYITDEQTYAKADQASVEEYEQFFAEQLTKAEDIIHISMAAGSGKSYHVAMKAAESFGHVHVIDSKQISCGQGLLVMQAVRLLQQNLTLEETIQKIDEMREKIVTQFIVPSINIFYQNGYTNRRVKTIFEALHLHPILKLPNGAISPAGFMVGDIDNCRKRFIRNAMKKRRIDTDVVFFTHVALSVREQEFVKAELKRFGKFDNIYSQKASVSCACNAGVGSVGFSYYSK